MAQMTLDEAAMRGLLERVHNRLELWALLLNSMNVSTMAEVGVYRGDFADHLLRACPSITRYYMIDPWQHLGDWNKPANKSDETFERFYQEALAKTEAAAEKRVVLRGRTLDVIDKIDDGELDFAYIDGDHTLRGITADLIRVFPKIREGGLVGGDDFCRSIFQHSLAFEPTLVFPYAVYFAEAVGARIYGLPYKQFLIEKVAHPQFDFVDLTGKYPEATLKTQLSDPRLQTSEQSSPTPAPARTESVARWALRKVARK